MDWTTKPLGKSSALSGKPFEEGDSVVSFVIRGEGDVLERRDFLASELTPETAPAGEILGRWTRVVCPRPVSEKQARAQALAGTEEMFLGLVADAENADEDRVLLVQMLALTLERRRVLRALGAPRDGVQRYWHVETKVEYAVKTLELTPERLMRVQPQLPSFD